MNKFYFKCKECESDINYSYSKIKMKKDRQESRAAKAKMMGTYESKEKKRKKRIESRAEHLDPEYMEWVKKQPCVVPGCEVKSGTDAHHSIHRSQGRDDSTCVSLCHFHHIGTYHGQLGSVEKAKEVWGIDLIEISKRMYARFSVLKIRT